MNTTTQEEQHLEICCLIDTDETAENLWFQHFRIKAWLETISQLMTEAAGSRKPEQTEKVRLGDAEDTVVTVGITEENQPEHHGPMMPYLQDELRP